MRRIARFALLPLLIVLGVFTMGAADTAARYNDLGHKLMCTCGCNEILLECNHIGCQVSAKMTAELRAAHRPRRQRQRHPHRLSG